MFFVLSKILDVFLSPYTWALAFLVLAIPWRRPRRDSSWKRRRLFGVLALGVLLVFSIEPVSNTLLYRLEHAAPPTYRPDVTYDAIVLLGGIGDEVVASETGQPAYNDNVERLTAAHRLLAEGRARYVIVTGAVERPERAEWGEAKVLARQLEAWGIDRGRILLEEQARNTHENAIHSERIARERGFDKVLVITSAFHMPRAEECFAAVGMKVDTFVVDYRAHRVAGSVFPRVIYLAESSKILRETSGLWIYRLRGYAKPVR